jgi:hypothetical protein
VCHLTGEIYRKMLCRITRQVRRARDGSRYLDDVEVDAQKARAARGGATAKADDERVTYITMCGLDDDEDGASWTLQYRIILSRNLLAEISEGGGIFSSFSTFITTPELSGPSGFYISPGIYHTQITEYFLDQIYL